MGIPVGGIHDITVYEAAGFREEFEVFEEDETTPIPFANGSTAEAQMRTSDNSAARLLAEFTVEITGHVLEIKLAAEDAVFDVPPEIRSAYYDIFVMEPTQEPIMFMEGKVKLNRNVTVLT